MEKDNSVFHCYSFNLCHFLQSQGFKYVHKKINPKNKLSYFTFIKSELLNDALQTWNELKGKSKLEGKNEFGTNGTR